MNNDLGSILSKSALAIVSRESLENLNFSILSNTPGANSTVFDSV
jgi:hypothetical protein